MKAAAGAWGFTLLGAGLWIADARDPLLALLLVVAASAALVVVGVRDLTREEPIMNKCGCHCGADTPGEFRPGHDLRVAARLVPGVRATEAAVQLVKRYGSVAEAARQQSEAAKGSTS